MHPVGALVTGAAAGFLFVHLFTLTQNRWRVDDVLGVWPLHGLCGAWGGIAAGIFGATALGGLGTVSLGSQVVGTLGGVALALGGGLLIYAVIRAVTPLRLDPEQEYDGADLTIHKVSASPERESSW
jgi:Amt family ammonium transporter